MPTKHTMPLFLRDAVEPEAYERWLTRKAVAHVVRDRKRGRACSTSQYKEAIHAAVLVSEGKDAYTGEQLRWDLISKYTNDASKEGKHGYKAGFALLPTVDHVASEATEASFKVCSWRTNSAKSDLSAQDFISVCIKVLEHAGYAVKSSG